MVLAVKLIIIKYVHYINKFTYFYLKKNHLFFIYCLKNNIKLMIVKKKNENKATGILIQK
ncbi:hypothetical protein BJ944DRAFT_268717 [Cunninghamella echinulata]|nr:hypothetical protein BJ944DRAFT_268717 [Cunninghamella echinulata]